MPWDKTETSIRSGHNPPGKYDRMRTIVISPGRGIKAVYGRIKGTQNWEVQSYIFSLDKGWTMDKAKTWFKTRTDTDSVAASFNDQSVSFNKTLVHVTENWTSVPVTLTKEGVMNGEYKTADAINALNSQALVAIPVIFDHPVEKGDPVIHDPETIIGITNELRVEDTDKGPALRGMMHLMNTPETENQRKTLVGGQPIGVSIGYFRELEEQTGQWNGIDYHAVENKVIPFHLGLMKDLQPACTITDGCGAGVSSTVNQGDPAMADEDTPIPVADLSLDALVGQNKCVHALQSERDELTAERDSLKEKVAELEGANAELQKAADELKEVKDVARNDRVKVLLERTGENLKEEDLTDATDSELERIEKLFPAPAAAAGSVGAAGDASGGADDKDPDPNRLFGLPHGESPKYD